MLLRRRRRRGRQRGSGVYRGRKKQRGGVYRGKRKQRGGAFGAGMALGMLAPLLVGATTKILKVNV